MFQVNNKVIQLYKYVYVVFQIIFHHILLQDIDYRSLFYTENFCACCISIFKLEI